jgi:hypothetical protein
MESQPSSTWSAMILSRMSGKWYSPPNLKATSDISAIASGVGQGANAPLHPS